MNELTSNPGAYSRSGSCITYFEKKRSFANELTDEWWILSAKYGVLEPDAVVEDYDATIKDVDVDAWLDQVEQELTDRLQERPEDTLWVLVGKERVIESIS